jgi:cysteine-rich repeat protein
MAVNTATLADIETALAPHGTGEVWAASLWEVYWQLVNAYGFDSDIFAGYTGSGGGNLALQLVMDGLKLQSCNPTFIEARDAILSAEANLTDEANRCLVWRGFAKRGLGANASVSLNPANVTATEDFTLPVDCSEFCADGAVALSEECDDENLLDLDGCSSTCRIEESYLFQGIAQGGTVEFVVDGATIPIVTLAGETPSDVALKMANAIGADITLNGLGVLAHAVGDSVVVSGNLTSTVITDLGLTCGDGLLAPIEQCDDANLVDLDGCSSTCRVETSYVFQGVAQGGTVEFVVEGEIITISTVAGETAADVALKMAAAIESNLILNALGVLAQGSGNSIIVAGAISSTTISDPGLAPPLPFSDWLGPFIALLLLVSGTSWLIPSQRRHNGLPNP